jgi:hypothetical protein
VIYCYCRCCNSVKDSKQNTHRRLDVSFLFLTTDDKSFVLLRFNFQSSFVQFLKWLALQARVETGHLYKNPWCFESQQSQLRAVQNFAARIITNSRKFDHVGHPIVERTALASCQAPSFLPRCSFDVQMHEWNGPWLLVKAICKERQYKWTLYQKFPILEHPFL